MELSVISYGDQPLPIPLSATLTPSGLSIGRGGENDLSLPDAERLVSRQQARIDPTPDGSHVITNVSHSNSFLINDFELVPGRQSALKPGDELRMGRFVILVSDQATPIEPWGTDQRTTIASQPAPSPLDPLDGFGSETTDDPLGLGLFDNPASVPPPPAIAARDPGPVPKIEPAPAQPCGQDGIGVTSPDDPLGLGLTAGISPLPQPTAFTPASGLIPEDFNPFDLPSAAVRNTDDPLAEISRSGETSLEQLAYPSARREDLLSGLPSFDADALAEQEIGGFFGGQTREQGNSQDPLALFGEALPSPSLTASQNDHAPAISAAFRPPEAHPVPEATPAPETQALIESHQAPQVPVPPLSSAPPAPMPSEEVLTTPRTGDDALIAAFLAGAGLAGMPPPRLDEQFMSQLGKLLSTATQGTVDLIQARAATKQELHAEVTIIAPRANNPLKFAPDGQAALHQLVGKRFPGFMAPVEAMQDAYDDLRAHQLGMTAGMRAALHDVLLRFSPAQIESRMTRHTLLDAVLPQSRKSQQWKLYTEMFEQIMDEAENAFDALFGKAFLEAYGREVDRLSQKETR